MEIFKSGTQKEVATLKSELRSRMLYNVARWEAENPYIWMTQSTFKFFEELLAKDKSNPFALYCKELTLQFCKDHHISYYYDVNQIKPGDKIGIVRKRKGKITTTSHDVIEIDGRKYTVCTSNVEGSAPEEISITSRTLLFGLTDNSASAPKFHFTFTDKTDNDMETNMTDFEKIIKAYLDQRAQEDAAFATTYAKPNKSISECCKYIMQEVAKTRGGQNCVALSDDKVFGMAIHYYDEDDIVVEASKVNATVAIPPEQVETPPETTEKKTKTTRLRKKKAEVDPNIPEPLEFDIF